MIQRPFYQNEQPNKGRPFCCWVLEVWRRCGKGKSTFLNKYGLAACSEIVQTLYRTHVLGKQGQTKNFVNGGMLMLTLDDYNEKTTQYHSLSLSYTTHQMKRWRKKFILA